MRELSSALIWSKGRQISRWRRGLRVWVRVVHALMLRDVLARYGHDNMGFFWLIGEPLLLTCGIMFVWTLMKATHGSNVGVIPFALTGYSFITLWRHVVQRSQKIMSGNAKLSYHRHVKMFDIMVAAAAIEGIGIFAAFMVALLPLWLLGLCPGMSDPLALVGGFVLTAWFSFSFGLLLAGLSELSEWGHHLLGPAMYLTLPLTGSFFLMDWLPQRAQQVMGWSPLVNGIEMIRGGLFPPDVPTYWSASYLALCAAGLTAIGLPLCRYAEHHVEG